MKLKYAPICSSRDALSDNTLLLFFAEIQIFRFWPKTMDYSPWFDFVSPKKVLRKVYHSIGNEKRNLMALVSAA